MNPLVTIFESCNSTTPKAHARLDKVLESIRSPTKRVATLVAKIRETPDKKARNELKRQLPAVVFAGAIDTRAADVALGQRNLVRSGLICLDLDALPDLARAREQVQSDPHTLAAWLSPSGDGLKVLVAIAGTWEAHWQALAERMRARYGIEIDEARKDVCGLCYASHDPSIWVASNPEAVEPFREVEIAASPDEPAPLFVAPRFAYSKDGEVLEDYRDSRQAEDPLRMVNADLSYEEWIEVGQAIHCQFGGSGEGLALWDSWSATGAKYPGPKEVQTHYKSFRSSGITFRTVLKKAIQAGWQMPRKTSSTAKKSVEQPKLKTDHLSDLINAEAAGTHYLQPWPWPILTQQSRSLMPGSVTILCGAPGSAKSWFGLSCLRYWIERDVRAAVLMLEEDKAWHLNRLLTQLDGNVDFLDSDKVRANPDEKRRALDRHRATIDRVDQALYVQNNLSMAGCAEWVEDRCKEGARVVIVDPITLADNGSEKPWEADRRFMARCQAAIVESGTSLILVTHPRKAPGLTQAGAPALDDMAGGAAYGRAAASVIWVGAALSEVDWVEGADGPYQATAHKRLVILKARNGVGCNQEILARFTDLCFEEVGIRCKNPPEDSGEKINKPTRKRANKPHNGEDLF